MFNVLRQTKRLRIRIRNQTRLGHVKVHILPKRMDPDPPPVKVPCKMILVLILNQLF
jgi:hypothetical protein